MAKLVLLLLLCAFVIQVYSMEIVNEFGNTKETEADWEVRFLFNGLARKCRAKINAPSTVIPGLPVTLTRLSNNRLYFFSPAAPAASRVTFDNAAKFCIEHGMHLVTINSQRENELVYSEAVSRGLTGTATALGAWIGLRDSTGISIFRWIQNGSTNTFNFFAAAATASQCVQYLAPANAAAANAETPATSWAGAVCTTTLSFICELEAPCSAIL